MSAPNSELARHCIEEIQEVLGVFVIEESRSNLHLGIAVLKGNYHYVRREIERIFGKLVAQGVEYKFEFFTPVGNEHNFF